MLKWEFSYLIYHHLNGHWLSYTGLIGKFGIPGWELLTTTESLNRSKMTLSMLTVFEENGGTLTHEALSSPCCGVSVSRRLWTTGCTGRRSSEDTISNCITTHNMAAEFVKAKLQQFYFRIIFTVDSNSAEL